MVGDFFIKIDGIDGESIDSKHSKWIEVRQFSFGSAQSIDITRGNDVSGRGQFQPFVFMHPVDKAMPKIQQFCMSGKDVPKVEFHACRAIGGKQVVVCEIKMENVKIIKAIAETILSGEAYQPVENVSLYAKKITWKVTPIKADNTTDGAVEASYDQVTNA